MTVVRPDADAALRLLLTRAPDVVRVFASGDAATVDAFVRCLGDNVVLLRGWRVLREEGVTCDALDRAAERERVRVDRALDRIARIAAALEGEGLGYVLPKAFQHAPDMGHDIDVLVPGADARAAALVARAAGAHRVGGSPASWFAGKRAYDVPEVGPLEVHASVGHVGEHAALARALIARRRRGQLHGVEAWVPSADDQLLFQVVQRLAGHRSIRASDALTTIALRRDVDEGRVRMAAARAGLTGALGRYLAMVEAIERRAHGSAERGIGSLVRPGGYAVPLSAVMASYVEVLAAAARDGRIGSAARVAAIAPLAVATIAHRLRPRG